MSVQPDASRKPTLVLIALIFAVAMTFIDQTIVGLAVPSLQQDLSLSDRCAVDRQRLPALAVGALPGRRQS